MEDNLKVGNVVSGTVVLIDASKAYVDINEYMDATLTKENYSLTEIERLTDVLKIGDEITAQVKYVGDDVIHLSRHNMEKDEAWLSYVDKFNNEETITVKFIGQNRGGIFANTPFEIFMPFSQIDLNRVDDATQYLNKELEVKIIDCDLNKKKLTTSRRVVLTEELANTQSSDIATVKIGETITAKIVEVLEHKGCVLAYKSVRVFLPAKEVSHTRLKSLKDVLKVGESLEVEIKDIDVNKKQLIVSRKSLLKTPWELAKEKVSVGSEVDLEVVHIFDDTGALLKVVEGVNAYLHQSEFSFDWGKTITNTLNVGEVIHVAIIDMDEKRQRISASTKRLEKDPWLEARSDLKEGAIVSGVVKAIRGTSANIELAPLVYGKLTLRDATDKEGQRMGDVCQIDHTIEAKIIRIDDNRRKIDLSIIQIAKDEERAIYEEYLQMKKDGKI